MIVKRLGLSQLGMSGSRHAVQRVSVPTASSPTKRGRERGSTLQCECSLSDLIPTLERRRGLVAESAVHALWTGERHELIDVAIGSSKVLPSRSGLAQELDARRPQLRYRLGQLCDLEANNRAGL